jgi:hypothetical protein
MRIYVYISIMVFGLSTAIADSRLDTPSGNRYRNISETILSSEIAAEVYGACVTYSNGSLQCSSPTLQSQCTSSSTQIWIQGGQCPAQ